MSETLTPESIASDFDRETFDGWRKRLADRIWIYGDQRAREAMEHAASLCDAAAKTARRMASHNPEPALLLHSARVHESWGEVLRNAGTSYYGPDAEADHPQQDSETGYGHIASAYEIAFQDALRGNTGKSRDNAKGTTETATSRRGTGGETISGRDRVTPEYGAEEITCKPKQAAGFSPKIAPEEIIPAEADIERVARGLFEHSNQIVQSAGTFNALHWKGYAAAALTAYLAPPKPPSKLEEVAKIIASGRNYCAWDLLPEDDKARSFKGARAAIEALRLVDENKTIAPTVNAYLDAILREKA